MLCCSRLDLMTVVPDAFAIVHEIIPNAASAIFLTSENGVPHRFFHEAPASEAFALFHDELHLFRSAGEHSVFNLVGIPGTPKIAQLLPLPKEWFSSNTYQLLVRPSGHHHVLDGRLEIDGRRAGLLLLFREPGCGFTRQDAENMARVTAHFEHALRLSSLVQETPGGHIEDEAIIACSGDGRIQFISDSARSLLNELPMMGPKWPDRRRLPIFLQRMIDMLRDGDRYPMHMPCQTVPIIGGALQAAAHWATAHGNGCAERAMAAADQGLAIITLKRITPLSLRIWKNLSGVALSPQQLEVAFWMGIGGRDAVRTHMAISESVLRDCVKAVFEVLDCRSQEDLASRLLRPAHS